MSITVETVKQLEERKEYLLQAIAEFAAEIIKERDNLSDYIHASERNLKTKEFKKTLEGVGTDNIYNIDTITAESEKESPEELKKKIRLCYRAYSTNPFKDKTKANRALALLDELEEVATQLDEFYNDKVRKAAAKLATAKKELKEADKARTNYRREVLKASGSIRSAVGYCKIPANTFRQHGENSVDIGVLFNSYGAGYDGKLVIYGLKNAIEHEQKQAEEDRKIIEEPEFITPLGTASIIDGEPVAVFDTKGVSAVSKKAFINPFKW